MTSTPQAIREAIKKIIEDEFEWGAKTGKTIRLHKITESIPQLILDNAPSKIIEDVTFDPPRNNIITIYKDGPCAQGYDLAIDTFKQILEGK